MLPQFKKYRDWQAKIATKLSGEAAEPAQRRRAKVGSTTPSSPWRTGPVRGL
jgi:hypothetical protein